MFAPTLKIPAPTRSAWRCVALLALLGFPLACDQTPTAPAPKRQPQLEASILGSPPPTVFDASYYSSIDFAAAAQQQYCPTYPAVRCTNVSVTQISGHLFGWRAVVTSPSLWGAKISVQYPIDMWRAVADQYCAGWRYDNGGCGYTLGAVGVGVNDWRAVHWSALAQARAVLPVVPIASDYFWDVSAVNMGLANLQSVIATTRTWYAKAMVTYGGPSKTFHVLQPLIVFEPNPPNSNSTAAQWNACCYGFTYQDLPNPDDPGGQLHKALNAFLDAYPPSWPEDVLLLGPFAGYVQPSMAHGWDWTWAQVAVVGPFASSLTCSWGVAGGGLWGTSSTQLTPLQQPWPLTNCQYATFDVAHSLAYTFGLRDSFDGSTSLMDYAHDYTAWPPLATLTASQITTLLNSGFFTDAY